MYKTFSESQIISPFSIWRDGLSNDSDELDIVLKEIKIDDYIDQRQKLRLNSLWRKLSKFMLDKQVIG